MSVKTATEDVSSNPINLDFQTWAATKPTFHGSSSTVDQDLAALRKFSDLGQNLLSRDVDLKDTIEHKVYNARAAFLRRHTETVYSSLTKDFSHPIRLDVLVGSAMERYAGLLPTAADIADDASKILKEKRGHERGIGLFLSHVFAHPRAGLHLLQSMLRPLPESSELAAKFSRDGILDLETAILRRNGKAAEVLMHNPDYLNAEDASTIGPMEQVVDVAILDADTEVCVLRGTPAQHPRYEGRNIFCSGINLTHLYEGKIPYLWYLVRDLGFVNKIAHGVLADEDA
ncbi:uncharacterized protein METZ01_LOCUS313215, partial [marine metagenome]